MKLSYQQYQKMKRLDRKIKTAKFMLVVVFFLTILILMA